MSQHFNQVQKVAMRTRDECKWCGVKRILEIKPIGIADICECGYDLTGRCSACVEMHNSECDGEPKTVSTGGAGSSDL